MMDMENNPGMTLTEKEQRRREKQAARRAAAQLVSVEYLAEHASHKLEKVKNG